MLENLGGKQTEKGTKSQPIFQAVKKSVWEFAMAFILQKNWIGQIRIFASDFLAN